MIARKVKICLSLCVLLSACQTYYTPKPTGYPRMILPTHSYQSLPDTLPYMFSYSSHALLRHDSSWMAEPYWIEIYYPMLEASIQITYKAIKKDSVLLREYLIDTYKLSAKHQIKAYSIEERRVKLRDKGGAMIFLTGEVPTQIQFYVTDSVIHFLRGALYFTLSTANDSLAPAIAYIQQDIECLLETLEWRTTARERGPDERNL